MTTEAEIRTVLLHELRTRFNYDHESSDHLWDHFPKGRGRRTAPEVTAFGNFVTRHFEVILSEAQWSNPTVDSLAKMIAERRAHPERMIKSFERHLSDTRKGLWAAGVGLGVMALVPLAALPNRGGVVVSIMGALVIGSVLWVVNKIENARSAEEMKIYLRLKSSRS